MRVVVALAALGAACGPAPAPRRHQAPTTPAAPGELLTAQCAANVLIPAILDCAFPSDLSGAGSVEYWPDDDPSAVRTTPPGPPGTAHAVAIRGLAAGQTYGWRAVVAGEGQRLESAPGVHAVPDVPADFPVPRLEIAGDARSEIADGYLLLALAIVEDPGFSVIAILDGQGRYVWWTRSDPYGLSISPRFSRDGRSVRVLQTDMLWNTDVGITRRISLDAAEIADTRALLGHHASWENADGTVTWLGFEYRTIDGKDWASDMLRTLPEGAADDAVPTEEFSWFDAYPVDPWDASPGETLVALGDGDEWTHSNSLMALDDTSFFVMSKKLDCLLRVDRATHAIVWQLGGKYADFTHPNGDRTWGGLDDNDLFSHAHMSQIWDGGFTVFDNGDFHDPQISTAAEYAFDEDAKTVEEVWRYAEPDGGHTASMGDVRKLPGGNYLVEWSNLGYVSEITPGGEVVWKVAFDLEGHVGRMQPLWDIYQPPDGGIP
jgi:hypothetical protein